MARKTIQKTLSALLCIEVLMDPMRALTASAAEYALVSEGLKFSLDLRYSTRASGSLSSMNFLVTSSVGGRLG